MTHEEIWREFAALPLEGQRQVVDFIAFLQQRYGRSDRVEGSSAPDLAEDGFIGIWRDREEIGDSSAWVRRTRAREWVK
ncbi:MAG: hypothetical protein ACR2G4_17525 [Pyrinomonadaceae bacterium]